MASVPQMEDLSLGARLQLARVRADLTKREAARRIGVSTDSLSDWENDVTEPGAFKLRRAAEVYDTSADWLLWGATRVFVNGESPALRLIQGKGPGQRGPKQVPTLVPVKS